MRHVLDHPSLKDCSLSKLWHAQKRWLILQRLPGVGSGIWVTPCGTGRNLRNYTSSCTSAEWMLNQPTALCSVMKRAHASLMFLDFVAKISLPVCSLEAKIEEADGVLPVQKLLKNENHLFGFGMCQVPLQSWFFAHCSTSQQWSGKTQSNKHQKESSLFE